MSAGEVAGLVTSLVGGPVVKISAFYDSVRRGVAQRRPASGGGSREP